MIDYLLEIDVEIRVEYDDGEPYGVIDAPRDVADWIAERIGVYGLAQIDARVREELETERQNIAADAAI